MTDEVLEKLILRCYMDLLAKNTSVPSISQIIKAAELEADRDCYDIIYGEDYVKDIRDENKVHEILSKYKHAHKFFDSVCFDAQNNLFDNWFEYQRLLGE